MKHAPLPAKSLLAFLTIAIGLSAAAAHAEGDPAPTYQRERSAQRFKACHWTDEMGKYVYDCIKKNDGFNAHWCYDESLELYCPAQLEAAKKAASEPAQVDKPQR